MPPSPSDSLIALLAQLRLATAGQAQSVSPRVSRLARDLPGFDSVWVDALAQARIITPFQAAEVNAGRGPALAVGPYVLTRPIAGPSYAQSFAAVERIDRAPAHLLVVDALQGERDALAAALERLVERGRLVSHPALRPVRQAGVEERRVWAACRPDRGEPAARWMVENGRFPAAAALVIARQIAAALVELEQIEIVHGDLSAWAVTIDDQGRVSLACPGLRPIVRRHEGYAFGDLGPEAYDTLAPERIECGASASVATDIYACGCLLWHLAAGRAPFAGGSTIAKLKSVHRAKAPDVAPLSVDAPPQLVAAIRASMAVDPAKRPPSFAALAEMLGPPTRSESASARKLLARDLGPQRLWAPLEQRPSPVGKLAAWLAIAACLGLLLAAPIGWRHRHRLAWWPARELAGETDAAAAQSLEPAGAIAARRAAHPIADGGGAGPRTHRAVPTAKADRPAAKADRAANAGFAGPRADRPNARADRADRPAEKDRVVPAVFHVPRSVVEPRILPTGEPQRFTRLILRDGQTVRGAGFARPLIFVSPDGLKVRGEDVTFENVDFVMEPVSGKGYFDDSPAEIGESADIALTLAAEEFGKERGAALVWLESQHAEFRGCSFQDAQPRSGRSAPKRRPSAIAWLNAVADGARRAPLPGLMTLDRCVFWNVDAAIENRLTRSIEINARMSLHVCSGPLVRLARPPRASQTVMLNLANVTLRAASAALECPLPDRAGPPSKAPFGPSDKPEDLAAGERRGAAGDNIGRIAIEAIDSVFAPAAPGALAIVDGEKEPERFFKHLEWTGHGSLVTLAAPIAAWRSDREGSLRELAEEDLQVAGLVRGEVEFEGPESGGPDASRLRRWQAPLRSSEPPGIGIGELALPRSRK